MRLRASSGRTTRRRRPGLRPLGAFLRRLVRRFERGSALAVVAQRPSVDGCTIEPRPSCAGARRGRRLSDESGRSAAVPRGSGGMLPPRRRSGRRSRNVVSNVARSVSTPSTPSSICSTLRPERARRAPERLTASFDDVFVRGGPCGALVAGVARCFRRGQIEGSTVSSSHLPSCRVSRRRSGSGVGQAVRRPGAVADGRVDPARWTSRTSPMMSMRVCRPALGVLRRGRNGSRRPVGRLRRAAAVDDEKRRPWRRDACEVFGGGVSKLALRRGTTAIFVPFLPVGLIFLWTNPTNGGFGTMDTYHDCAAGFADVAEEVA